MTGGCSKGGLDDLAAFVRGGVSAYFGVSGAVYDTGIFVDRALGVRPAIKLNLSSVIFSSESKTFSLKP